jgi:hypothetical protein
MKKIIYLIALIVLLAPPLWAQEKTSTGGQYQLGTPFEGDVRLGYRWNMTSGNPMAGEYEYQHSSAAGSAIIEYDPLPTRFLFETYVQNSKDYFTELDYSYKDIIMLNLLSRSMYHNLDHYSIGQSTTNVTVTDLNPEDMYGTSNAMNRGQIRFKAPDFPFHIYLEAKNQEKHGTVQQRFMNSFTIGDKISRSRNIDYETQEAKITVNSHLSWVEVEYSHATKNFKDTRDKVMTDTSPSGKTYTHNLVPELESTTDTFKVHTSHTGRIAAAVTVSSGDKKNKDSGAKSDFMNTAGDISWIPTKDITVAVKYRHYDVNADNPTTLTDTVTTAGLPVSTTYPVRTPISYQKDILTGMVRYRWTKDLTVRLELGYENLKRDVSTDPLSPDYWMLDDKVDRTTARLGATYRLTNRIILRGDISHQSANVPANSVDNTYPETSDQVRLMATWAPKPWFNMLLSGATVREERSGLNAPFTDKWTNERDRLLGSFTFLVGKSTSVTPSYSFFQNKHTGPIAYTDDPSQAITAETGVPYADTAQVAALSLSHVLADTIIFTADVGKSWSRGSWQNSGVVAGSDGIAGLTSIKVVDTMASADLEIRVSKNLGYDLRYQIRRIDDKLDDAQDGTNQIVLATLSWKW